MKYFVYLARCKNKSLYIGSCANLKARELKHNAGGGSKYTKQRSPVKIIYFEEFGSLVDARKREAQIKKWSRIKKEKLIQYSHPTKK